MIEFIFIKIGIFIDFFFIYACAQYHNDFYFGIINNQVDGVTFKSILKYQEKSAVYKISAVAVSLFLVAILTHLNDKGFSTNS